MFYHYNELKKKNNQRKVEGGLVGFMDKPPQLNKSRLMTII